MTLLMLDPEAVDEIDAACRMLAEFDLPDAVPAPYQCVEGVAIVRVQGLLFQSIGTLYDYSFASGYDAIGTKFDMAVADDDVRAIVLDVNSPGGPVNGCFDLVDRIYAARAEKPIMAILTENALSAAYAIASAASSVWVPRTGNTGSIGVISTHTDMSRMLDQIGITVTDIIFGDRKADFAPTAPLSKPALDAAQARVNALGEMFVETVARNRDVAASKVRATEAAIFLGADGVKAGLADGVAAPGAAFRALLKAL